MSSIKLLSIILTLTVIFLVIIFGMDSSRQVPIRAMSFNIRYDNPNDGEDAWPNRKENVVSMVLYHKADIVGMQEVLKHQAEYIAENLPGFSWFGVGRDDGKDSGEYSPVFYNKESFDLIEQSTFWLSDTPENPSVGWNAALPRIVTWGHFKHNLSGAEFYFFNTHFDHRGDTARAESAKLIISKIQEIAVDDPVIVAGDFNAGPGSEPYEVLSTGILSDTKSISQSSHHGPAGTFTGFDINVIPRGPIDHIFVSSGITVTQHATLADVIDGHYPSDHFPVLAEIVID